jgi:hypothetical protein
MAFTLPAIGSQIRTYGKGAANIRQPYLFYHAAGPSTWERQVCAEELTYNDDGTIKPMQMTRPEKK